MTFGSKVPISAGSREGRWRPLFADPTFAGTLLPLDPRASRSGESEDDAAYVDKRASRRSSISSLISNESLFLDIRADTVQQGEQPSQRQEDGKPDDEGSGFGKDEVGSNSGLSDVSSAAVRKSPSPDPLGGQGAAADNAQPAEPNWLTPMPSAPAEVTSPSDSAPPDEPMASKPY